MNQWVVQISDSPIQGVILTSSNRKIRLDFMILGFLFAVKRGSMDSHDAPRGVATPFLSWLRTINVINPITWSCVRFSSDCNVHRGHTRVPNNHLCTWCLSRIFTSSPAMDYCGHFILNLFIRINKIFNKFQKSNR